MKKTILTLFVAFTVFVVAKAQPLSGVKTVGVGGDFPTLQAAITTLTTNGVSANVVFNIKTSASPYIIGDQNITTFTGHGLFNVTFQAESGNADDVKIENSASHNYIIHCWGVDNISFKNLSFTSLSSTWSNIFMLDYDADNITIESCKLKGNYTYAIFESQYSLIYVDDFIIGNNSTCDSLVVRNCLLDGGMAAITISGNSNGGPLVKNTGAIIENNKIINQKKAALKLYNCSGFFVKMNSIKPTSITSMDSSYEGIGLANCDGAYSVENNQIHIENAYASGNVYGIHAENSNNATLTTASNFGKILNNMIFLYSCYPSMDAIGIYFKDCNYSKFYHNTIYAITQGSGDNYCFSLNTSQNIEFKNNLLRVGTFPFLIRKDASSTLVSNYNVYFGYNGIGTPDGGTNFYNNLSAWQAATSTDANSIEKQVSFYGEDSDYSGNYSSLELDAFSVADPVIQMPRLTSVANDIYGKPRFTSTNVGAFERFPTLAGTYTIDNALPYPSPAGTFISYRKAVQALASGVSGPVVFEAVGGTYYNEQVTIPSISGASNSNTIKFTQKPLTAVPTIAYNSTLTPYNFIVFLDSVNYLTFANTNFSPQNTNNGNIFKITQGSNITFSSCGFLGQANAGISGYNSSAIYSKAVSPELAPQNVTIANCTFLNGGCGVNIEAIPTSFANAWVIRNNIFTAQTNAAIELKKTLNAEIANNTINGNSTDKKGAYYAVNCVSCEGKLKIEKNKISITTPTPTVSFANEGVVVTSHVASLTNNSNYGVISNNMIRVSNSTSKTANAIRIDNTGYKYLYHNTAISDTANSGGNTITINNVTDSIKIYNNIFHAYSSNKKPVFLTSSSTYLLFNYNNFKAQGSGSVNIATVAGVNMTLPTMQTSYSYNLNSNTDTVFFTDPFIMSSDLHLSGASINNANLKGIKTPITIDIDGDVRNINNPFMGADEGCGSPLALAPSSSSTISVCTGSPALTAGTNYGGSLLWYSVATGGVGSAAVPTGFVGTTTVYVSEKLGTCESARTPITVSVAAEAVITGTITVNSTPVTSGTVYLFKQRSANNRMDTVATQIINSANYLFTNVAVGNYLVAFKPNAASNPNTPSTFNGNKTDWTLATLITPNCATTLTHNINATSLAGLTGTGTISGRVEEGYSYGKTTLLGDPIPGVDISLEQNPGGIIVAQTQSDIDGKYAFINLPLNDYRVRVNIPGTTHTGYYDVTLTNDNPSEVNLIYVVDSNYIFPLGLKSNANKKTESNTVIISPNPLNKEAKIILPNEWKKSKEIFVSITDIAGKELYFNKYTTSTDIVISRNNLENGMYFVKIKNGTNFVTKKIVITD